MEDLPTLQSLADESPRGTKPVYSWLTLTKCAISGSPNKTLTAEEIIEAIQERFMFFTFERAGDWKTYIINTLSNTPCFSPTGAGVFSPDALYWEYDSRLDKDRENAVLTYVPSPGPSTRSGSVGPFASSSAAGGSGASTPQHGGSSAGGVHGVAAQASRPSSPVRERSERRRRHEERERRRQARERERIEETQTQERERDRDRGAEREGGRERERERERRQDRERARTRERDAPASRDGSTQRSGNNPRPRTKSNPTRPPPLNFGTSSNFRSNTAPNPTQPVPFQVQPQQDQYRSVLQHAAAQNDGQELPMPPRLGRERDPDTGSLRSFRSFRSLIDAATSGASGIMSKDKGKSKGQPVGEQSGVGVPPTSCEPLPTEQQRRKMEKEQEKARKKMEKQQRKEAEAQRKAQEKEREKIAKSERDKVKAIGLADKLKTMGRGGSSYTSSNPSSISGHVYPVEPGSAVQSYHSQAGYNSGLGGRGTPQPGYGYGGALQTDVPFVLDLLESATSEVPPNVLPLPPKNSQERTLKKAKSFLLFWKA